MDVVFVVVIVLALLAVAVVAVVAVGRLRGKMVGADSPDPDAGER